MDGVERCETQCWYCESDASPSSCQEIPGDDQGASDEDLWDGVNGGAHVEEEED
jgi:hypothetical protein